MAMDLSVTWAQDMFEASAHSELKRGILACYIVVVVPVEELFMVWAFWGWHLDLKDPLASLCLSHSSINGQAGVQVPSSQR